jgi:hypothetical protein
MRAQIMPERDPGFPPTSDCYRTITFDAEMTKVLPFTGKS